MPSTSLVPIPKADELRLSRRDAPPAVLRRLLEAAPLAVPILPRMDRVLAVVQVLVGDVETLVPLARLAALVLRERLVHAILRVVVADLIVGHRRCCAAIA